MLKILIKGIMRLRDSIEEEKRRNWGKKTKESFEYCGEGVVLKPYSQFFDAHKISIGNNVDIGWNGWFVSGGGLKIGDNAVISRNCVIYTASHDYEGDMLPFASTNVKRAVNIGKNVWIGMNVTIIPGITIGEGAIVGLGTIVTKDVPPLAIIGSQGHRVIKYRNKEHYDQVTKENRFIIKKDAYSHYQ